MTYALYVQRRITEKNAALQVYETTRPRPRTIGRAAIGDPDQQESP